MYLFCNSIIHVITLYSSHVYAYYVSMLRCCHLVWNLVRTDHPCLGVGCHSLSRDVTAAAMGSSIGRAVAIVGTSYMWWILAAAASTLDSTLAAGSRTMDTATALGTSSMRDVDAAGNVVDVVRSSSSRRVRSGMISVFP
jgi:hypothetical protein